MSIISRTYFKGSIFIPNSVAVSNSDSLSGKQDEVDFFIEQYERDILIKCLTYNYYKELQDNLEIKEGATYQTIKDDAPQKWKDFFNGKDYQIGTKNYRWPGIVFTLGTDEFSLIAYYTFYHYLKADSSRFTGNGTSVTNTQNATIVNPTQSLVDAWNEFYKMTASTKETGIRSLNQFMADMNSLDPTNFPDWESYIFKPMNVFGI